MKFLAGQRIRGTNAERTGLTTNPSVISSGISKTGCLAYYNFEQTSGDLVNQATSANGFTDGTGTVDNGTNNGATQTATGKVGSNCWSFDGINDNVFLPIGMPSTMSSTLWIKPTGSMGSEVRIWIDESGSTGSGSGFSLALSTDNKISLQVYTNTWTQLKSTTTLSADTWYHVVVVRGSSIGQKVYINGVLENSGSYQSYTNLSDIRLGADYYNGSIVQAIPAEMDEFSIWNRELTASEISSLYEVNPNLQDGSIFYETDTNKSYVLSSNTWTEL